MFRFVRQIFVSALMHFGNLLRVNPLKCISMKNQECKVRPEIIDINSNDPMFCPFSIKPKNVSTIVIILVIHMQEFVFQML